MRPHTKLFRLGAASAVAGLLLAPLPLPSLAQTPPLPAAAPQQQGDPPARVGRLARIAGGVSFHTADADAWSPAEPNYPVTSGDTFWTEPNAQAELQVDADRIALAGGTEFAVATLDQAGMQATLAQGEIYLHLRGVPPGESWALQTPRGQVSLAGNGRYAVTAGDTATPTTVTVLDGSAQVSGPDFTLRVGPGQAAFLTGTETFTGSVGPAQPDAFVTAMLASERPPPQPAIAPPPIVAMMPGGDDLAEYGTWTDAPEYGPVWYPRVEADWVPYREGRWVWVSPWGWTWVDSDPWGFTPFHYGRWVELGGRWAWTPGVLHVAARPVYAPALVTFFGVAAGVGLGAALAGGHVGWLPLGPREAYHPWYHASDRYLREINIRHVTNVTNITAINRSVTINNYANRRAATMVPAAVLQASRPVRAAAQRISPQELAAAHPMAGQRPVAPTRATFGVTPAVARHTALAPAPAGMAAVPHAAPGPAIRAVPQGAGLVRPQAGMARPPLHRPNERTAPPALRPMAPSLRTAPSGAAPRPPLAAAGASPTRPEAAPHAVRPNLVSPAHPAAPTPPRLPAQPGVPYHAAAPAPQVQQPKFRTAPQVQAPHAAPPAHEPQLRAVPQVHPAPQVHQVPQVPQVHQVPQVYTGPQVHTAPQYRSAPQVHAAPAPHPAPMHAAPMHVAPQPHAAPAAAQHPQQGGHERRPNEH